MIQLSSRISIVVCDTQPVTAEGLRTVITGCPDLEFVSAEQSLAAGAELIRSQSPKVALLDKAFGTHGLVQWMVELRPLLSGTAVVDSTRGHYLLCRLPRRHIWRIAARALDAAPSGRIARSDASCRRREIFLCASMLRFSTRMCITGTFSRYPSRLTVSATTETPQANFRRLVCWKKTLDP